MKIGSFYTVLDRKSPDCRKLKLFKPPPYSVRALQALVARRKYGCMGNGGH